MNSQELLPFLKFPSNNPPVIRDGKIWFLNHEQTAELEVNSDIIYQIKNRLKNKMGFLYVLCVEIFSPVCQRIYWRSGCAYWRHILNTYLPPQVGDQKKIIIQIGSGSTRIRPEILNFDIFGYPDVDVVADCTNLPFYENSIDGVVSLAVLEHVEEPELFIRDAYRALKPGGMILTTVPFMQGYHSSPDDFYRWTYNGIKSLHEKEGFSTVLVENLCGPTSSLIWILRDWLAVFFSFNISFIYYPLLALFTALLFPFKFLDLFLVHSQFSKKIGSAFIFVGKK